MNEQPKHPDFQRIMALIEENKDMDIEAVVSRIADMDSVKAASMDIGKVGFQLMAQRMSARASPVQVFEPIASCWIGGLIIGYLMAEQDQKRKIQ